MAAPTGPQLEYVTTEIVQLACEKSAHPDHRRRLMAALADWFPDADEFDLRKAADDVARRLDLMRVLLAKRRLRLIDEGKAEMPT